MTATLDDSRITFECDFCGNAIRASREHAGRTGTCKNCSMSVTIPFASAPIIDTTPNANSRDDGGPVERDVLIAKRKSAGSGNVRVSNSSASQFYWVLGYILVAAGLMVAVMAVASDSWVMAGLAGGGIMIASIPLFVVASVLQDIHTIAECSRGILQHLNETLDDY